MALPPGTQDRAWQAFTDVCGAASESQFRERLFRSPVLLRHDVVQWLVERLGPTDPQGLIPCLQLINHLRMSTMASDYPLGDGPVEVLWRRLEDGEISQHQANVAARQLPITESLMGLYVTNLFFSIGEPSMPWHQSRTRGQLLVAAVEACSRKDERPMRRARLLGVTRWTHFLLIQVPEVAMLELGDAAGREALSDAQQANEAEEIRNMGYELAALWGDAYVTGRTDVNYGLQDYEWRRRGERELGEGEGAPPSAWDMPKPEEALSTSLRYWRIARAAEPTDPTVLIGLVEAGWFYSKVTGSALEADVITALREGLALTAAPDTDPVLRNRFLTFAGIDH
jgi:hypothetical protein